MVVPKRTFTGLERKHLVTWRFGISTLLLALYLTGCGSGGSLPVKTELVPYDEEQLAARKEARNARYRIRVGDELRLSFKFEPLMNQESVLVLPDGHISTLDLETGVKAAGRTIDELDQELTQEYGKDMRNPDLSIIVLKISDPQIYVLGEVRKPGLYKLPTNGTGVIQAIAMAGGYTEHAKKSYTAVLRATDEGFMVRSLDLSGMEHTGFADMSYFDLQMYDVIYVPRSSLGNWAYYTEAIFGSALNISRFFWDISAIANVNNIGGIYR